MKNVLASIGIGNASVDTVLPAETVQPGETVDAQVQIVGGNAEQEIGTIRFEIETRYLTDEGYEEVDVDRFTLAEGLTIEPDQEETRNVSIDVPYDTPVTIGNVDVWIETELDIDLAVDPEDTDYLDVRPTDRLQTVFDAMEELGFTLHTAECEADPYGRYTGGRFVQEFEFRVQSGQFRGDLDEVELVARPGPDELELFVEIDRKGGLLSEMTDTDERTTRVTITSTDRAAVREQLGDAIEQHA
ncbi:sporulation protein [Halomicrobium sp. LC1Hm]|uniref:sporulation protein n=1 Tax=Halomicrobium sp. LC1Hm TaxID=2610902 RepID=UPI001298420C|nr:sporulation protein [Halomicrobium sp. LC1Hm]QGA82281.1 Sporulation control protein [Halomicrobium sp. LC1Hm]